MSGITQVGRTPLAAVALVAFTVAERRLTLPDTAVDLVWADERVTVIGPMRNARPTRLAVGSRALLPSLDPLIAATWLRMPLDLLTDQAVDLADIDRCAAAELEERFAGGRVGELVGSGRPGGRLALAASALTQGAQVAQVAERVGLSERQLARSFKRRLGLHPKRFARIARLRRAVQAAKSGAGLAHAAAAAGFADQAHLSREMKTLTGLSPRQALPHVGNVQDLGGVIG